MSTPLISADNTWALMCDRCFDWRTGFDKPGYHPYKLRLVRRYRMGLCCSYGNPHAAVELRHS